MSGKIEIDANQEFETSSTGLTGMLNSIIDAGRGILNRRRQATAEAPSEDLLVKCRQLLHHRGEASGLALACEIIASFQSLDKLNKIIFFEALANDFGADSKAILVAADRYRTEPTAQNLADLSRATDSYRIKLFRRMNMAPN
ncbi:MAG TPA: decarboxylase, partial [Porticoccaceae bacterium]|nr:decarboxylase [Porticoccaceae bacterium]